MSTEISSDEEDSQEKAEQTDTTEINDSWFPDQAFAANKNVLIEVEELEEKIFAASLQVKARMFFIKMKRSPHFLFKHIQPFYVAARLRLWCILNEDLMVIF